jgi:tetratricopeptide (TPR) repeat protein
MLESITRESVSWGVAEAIHRQTEGNPLFVQEVVRYVAEEGLIARKGDRWRPTGDTPLEMSIPEGLRDVIGKRLSLLSPECNQLLSVASVIGREFALETLRAVAGTNENVFANALKEAVRLSVLEERSQRGMVRYRFTHAFFRQTLYEEIIAPERLKLHLQVARSLETIYAKRLDEHATELTEHFSHSTESADLKKAVQYGEMAAKTATDVYAYGEAVRLLEQTLRVQKVLDPQDKLKICDLLLALGWARFYNHEYRHVLDNEAPAALTLAEGTGDTGRASKACLLASFALAGTGKAGAFARTEASKWIEAFDDYAPPGTIERVWADRALAAKKEAAGDLAGAWPLFRQSTLLARELGDASAFVNCGADYLYYCPPIAEYVEEARQIANEMRQGWDRADPFSMGYGMESVGSFFLWLGERREGEAIHREAMESTRLARAPARPYFFSWLRACYHIMDGQLEEAARCYEEVLKFGGETDAPEAAAIYAFFIGPRLAGYLGCGRDQLRRFAEWAQAADLPVPVHPLIRTYYLRAYCLVCTGESEEVVAVLDEAADHYAAEPERPKVSFGTLVLLLETAVLGNHKRATEILFNLLAGGVYKTTGLLHPTCVARHLGGAAALLGRHREAREHYKEAIKVGTEMKFRPELALTRLQLAELLLEHYLDEKKEALEHLDFAIKEFQEMKMQPWLERALKHKEILKA